MPDICLIQVFGAETLCIAPYILYGMLLALIGIIFAVTSAFIPIDFIRKLSLILISLGLILAIGFPLIRDFWVGNTVLQVFTYVIAVLIMVMVILFSDFKKNKVSFMANITDRDGIIVLEGDGFDLKIDNNRKIYIKKKTDRQYGYIGHELPRLDYNNNTVVYSSSDKMKYIKFLYDDLKQKEREFPEEEVKEKKDEWSF